MICVVCSEPADRYADGHPVCKHCGALISRDIEREETVSKAVDTLVARGLLAQRYPSIAKKLRGGS